MIIDDVLPFIEPKDRTVDNWLVIHYRKWLKIQGLSDKGAKEELKKLLWDTILFWKIVGLKC